MIVIKKSWSAPFKPLLTFALFAGTLSILLSGCSGNSSSFSALESGFHHPPDSVRIGCYWYWISDNISKEGALKDLEAMKKAGIGRAFIGNIGIPDLPCGSVKLFSDEWWDILHAVMKRAGELDIEIGMFNSPGWSQSGGPWVKPEESMRYLASADTVVKGGKNVKISLPNVGNDAQDVKVIAYPKPSAWGQTQSKTWDVRKKKNEDLTVDLNFAQSVPVRSLVFKMDSRIRTNAELFVKDGAAYRSLRKFRIDRINTELNVGFDRLAPVAISLPETKASAFRLVLTEGRDCDAHVTLSSAPVVERYAEKSLAKMYPEPLPMWDDYMWDVQPEAPADLYVSPKQVIDLTAKASGGVLTWDAPEGEWIVSRLAMKSTGVTNAPASAEGTGLEVDKINRKHVAAHFDAFIGEVLRRIPEQDRKMFKVVVADSYETGGQNWTDGMIERFRDTYKYDPTPYLPALKGVVVGSEDESDRFLWDLRRLVADGVAYEYVGGLRQISNRHGLTTWLENYGHWGFPGEFLQYGGQSDEIGGEFWSEGSLGDIENRAASSCGHIYGKRKIWAESCTSGGPAFSRYPKVMKERVDRFFTEGINSSLLHVYIQQLNDDREPGMDAWFGNEFNRKNTWFSQMDLFTDYLRRCNFMLQQGLYVADVAYFIGEDAPKMTGIRNPEIPKGYQYDYINAEVLLTRASVVDGKLTLPDGMQYSLLVLPPQTTIRPSTMDKIYQFVDAGLKVMGTPFKRSPSMVQPGQTDDIIKAASDILFGEGKDKARVYGKGRVYLASQPMEDVFADLQILPDFSLAGSPDAPVKYIHRRMDDGEIYFIANQSQNVITFSPAFRVTGKIPEWWNPVTGEVRALQEFTVNSQTTSIPLELQPQESGFVVFRTNGTPSAVQRLNIQERETLATVSSPWQVTFEKGKRGPDETVMLNGLQDWSTSDDARIRHFSGTAVYRTTFTVDRLPTDKTLYVDLGKVMVMARVTLNGKPAGGVWTPPYRVNVDNLLRKGENTLEVEVVNNWQNRMIGDQQLPESDRRTWAIVNPWRADSKLQESGLLGPVEVVGY